MRPAGYLLPPVQRSIARFMNLSGIIKWSKRIIAIFPQLNENERQVFNFVKVNIKQINGLSAVFNTVNSILKILKTKGMSEKSISECMSMLQTDMNIKGSCEGKGIHLCTGWKERRQAFNLDNHEQTKCSSG
jgi:hypothetical protein